MKQGLRDFGMFPEYDGDIVKRASIIVGVLLLSTALFAQVRGVPASVTSFAPGRGMAPGVPASITSLGPNGYSTAPCTQPGCGNAYFFYPIGTTPGTIAQPGRGGHHHPGGGGGHHGHNGRFYNSGGYVYVPYTYPVPVAVEPEEEEAQPEQAEPPAPTVFEHRSVVQPAPYTEPSYPVQQQATEPEHHNMSPVSEEKIPVVVVYKDGRQLEIQNGNYAIVGDMLYDLSGPIAKKIKLADLNLTQTIQQNEQRGVEFTLPSSYKPPA